MKRFFVIFFVFAGFFSVTPVFASTYGTDFLSSCPTVTVDSTLGGNVGSNAFDGNTATFWSNNNTQPAWIKCDLGVGVTHVADRIRFMGSNNPDNATIKDWQLLGSNNDSTYDVIATSTAANLINQLTYQVWEFATTSARSAYRYYKFQIDNDYRPGDDYKQVVEWQLQTCATDCFASSSTSTVGFTGVTFVSWGVAILLLFFFLPILATWLGKGFNNLPFHR